MKNENIVKVDMNIPNVSKCYENLYNLILKMPFPKKNL